MKKQPEITEKTKQAFLDAFCDFYEQKPIEKISVQEIADAAGYNRSTFYQYFCDIYELLECVENDVIDYMQKKVFEGKDDISDIIKFYKKKDKYLKALLGDYGSQRFVERLKIDTNHEEMHGIYLSDKNPLTPYLKEFHFSITLSLFRLWQRRQKDLTIEELTDLMLRLYTGGMSSFLD